MLEPYCFPGLSPQAPTQLVPLAAGAAPVERPEPHPQSTAGPFSAALYRRFFEQAERVRWRMTDIPWQELEPGAAPEPWRSSIAELARAELVSFASSHQLITRFASDPDFSQWLALWLYEEAKHPQALMLWLERIGAQASGVEASSRPRAQLATSTLGTFTLHAVHGMLAAEAYLSISRAAPEPVLRHITLRIAADQARHAAHFFNYGQRRATGCAPSEAELKDALEVLYPWLCAGAHLAHPATPLLSSLPAASTRHRAPDDAGWISEALRARICGVIGQMLGLPLAGRLDVERALRSFQRCARSY